MLIPTVIALSEFFVNNFPDISWYPYWYLGNPYYYLIGPVVPILLGVVRWVGGVGTLEAAYLLLALGSLALGGFGLYLLLKNWEVSKAQAIASGVLYAVLPAGFYLLNYQNGLNHIAFGLLPFVFLLFKKILDKENKLLIVFLTFTITIMILTNVSMLLPLVIGFIALFVSAGSIRNIENKIGKTVLIVLLSLSLSTFWYTPKFWWVIATNPSLGGVPFGKLIWSILQFLLQILPLVFAIAFVKFRKYNFQKHLLFGLLIFISFLFLSLVRFVSDPDFVMDWIGFSLELQFGLSILLGGFLAKLIKQEDIKNQKSKIKITTQKSKLLIFIGFILLSTYVSIFILKNLIGNLGNDYQKRIITILQKNVKENERVFLSGSSVFFINSKLNVLQVRGGVDQSSINPIWADSAYQIREGENGDLAYDWLKAMGVSYILVHDSNSNEPYRDFKHADKFADLKLISEDKGDNLFKVQDSHIARVADKEILNVKKPKNGADYKAINNYILSFKRPLDVNNQKPNKITISGDIGKNEIISLAVSYNSLWNLAYGKGKTASDSLGNLVIIPKYTGIQRFEVVFKRSALDLAIPLVFSIVIVIIIAYYNKISPYVRKKLPKLHVGLRDEEE